MCEDSENFTSEIQQSQSDNSIYSQDNEGDHNSNNYNTGNIIYSTNNYDSLRNFQAGRNNKYESEDNNYNSIKGDNYSSSVPEIYKR